MPTRSASIVATLLASLWLTGAVRAEDRAAARQAYNEGSKHYDLSQYAEALEAFKRAYWHSEEPAILFNIAQCHRALKHKAEAIEFYRSYLRKAASPPNREAVQKIIAELESASEADKTLAKAPPQGTLASEGQPAADKPSAGAPPPPAITAAVAAPAKPARPAWKRPWVWGLVAGVVVAGVAVGVGVGVGAQAQPPQPTDGVVAF